MGDSGRIHLDAQAKACFRVVLDISGVCNELKCEDILELGVIQEGEMEMEFRGVLGSTPKCTTIPPPQGRVLY